MSIISKEFLKKIAEDRLDDFFYYRKNHGEIDATDALELNKRTVFHQITEFEFSKDNPDIYKNIQYKYNGETKNITSASENVGPFVIINGETYYFYIILPLKNKESNNDKYYIKHNNKYYKFLHKREYCMIFTCIAILHTSLYYPDLAYLDYLDIFDVIIGIKFNRRFDIYRPAIYHILDGYLSNKADGWKPSAIDDYLIYRLEDKTIHFIDEIYDYLFEDNNFIVYDSIKYKTEKGYKSKYLIIYSHTEEKDMN